MAAEESAERVREDWPRLEGRKKGWGETAERSGGRVRGNYSAKPPSPASRHWRSATSLHLKSGLPDFSSYDVQIEQARSGWGEERASHQRARIRTQNR
jgi:hypothetical protein